MNQGVPYNKAPLSFMLNNKLFYQEVVYTKIKYSLQGTT